jgi:hypothetical protein
VKVMAVGHAEPDDRLAALGLERATCSSVSSRQKPSYPMTTFEPRALRRASTSSLVQ